MMLEWNRNIGSIIQLFLVIFFFILLVINRKKLGPGIIYFIISSGVVMALDAIIFIMRITVPQFNSTPLYTVGVNFFVFLLFFLYFHAILELKRNKRLNLVLTFIFVVIYLLFAIFSDQFFYRFPYKFYFIEVIILLGNIYLVLHETFNTDKVLYIRSFYPFWACIGLMTIYLGVTPLLIISNSAMQLMNINIFFIILFIVNVIGYSILITGIFFAENINSRK